MNKGLVELIKKLDPDVMDLVGEVILKRTGVFGFLKTQGYKRRNTRTYR